MAGWQRVLVARDRFVAAAREAGPEASTLCEGWTVADLVAHLLTLQRDPLSWAGHGIERFSPLTERRMQRALGEGFDAALARLAGRSPAIPAFLDDPWHDFDHHLGEYTVHTEDVVRANEMTPTSVDTSTADALWRRVQPAARILHRHGGGLMLERSDAPACARIVPGHRTLHVIGEPLELMMFVYRGVERANVRLVGAVP